MGLLDVLKDDFTAGTLLEQYAGNGSFAFPGTVAQITCPNSQSCNYDNNEADAPVLWTGDFSTRSNAKLLPVRIETKLNSYVRTTTSTISGLLICDGIDTYNLAYQFGYYAAEARIIVAQYYGTGGARRATSGAVVDPNTTPHLYRFYWNQNTIKPFYIAETGTVLAADYVGFAYSVDGGSTWTMLHTRARDFEVKKTAVFARKWATGAGDNCTAEFEYFYAQQYEEEDVLVDPPVGGASFEDEVIFPATTGEADRGPIDSNRGIVKNLPGASFEDEVILPPAGGPARHTALELDQGAVIPHTSASFEEGIVLQVYEGPDYMDAKDDGDGTEFLQGYQTRALLAKDLTDDPWHLHGLGFFGTARDGKNYYNNEECSPTGPAGLSFGTVAGGPNRRCWSLWHKSPPLDYTNSTYPIVVSIPSDGVVRFVGTGMNSEGAGVYPLWYLDGDFDVQVDWDNFSESGGTDGGPSLIAWTDPSNRIYVRRRTTAGVAENGRLDSAVKVNNSEGSTYASVDAGGATSGKFRITRIGTTVHRYYWGGSSWVELGAGIDMGRAEPMYVGVDMWGSGGLNCSVDFFDVVINSGTVINTAAWAREPLGDHRGNGDEFPLKHLWVATDDSLSIIDTENDLMWMRFIEGSGNPLNTDWGGTEMWVHKVAFRGGVAVLAWHGGLVRIDFNISEIRAGRLLTDTNRGAVKLDSHGVAYSGQRSMASNTNSHIILRNASSNFSTPSLDAWAIPSRDVNAVDLLHSGEYEFIAAGTAAGIRILKWRRWYFLGVDEENIRTPDWSEWNTANDVEWILFDETTGELFWHDRTNMYSAPRTSGGSDGWEDRMDESTFPAAVTKALPGIREWRGQYVAVKYGSYIFIAADEGIYRVNWPSGSWELFYGNVASVATHKILPNYSFPTSLALGRDDAELEDVLVVGMFDGTAVVTLSDNTLHSQTPVKLNQRIDLVAA